MNIRLIGLGDVGQEVVVACSQYFHSRQIVSLLESKRSSNSPPGSTPTP